MITCNVLRSATVTVVLIGLGIGNPVFAAEEGLLKSTGAINQTVTITKSIDMLQAAAGGRQAVNLVAGKTVKVNDVTQTVTGDDLSMIQIALGSSQAVNAVIADSPEDTAVGALADIASAASAIGSLTKFLKR
jgi:hypothetical protein